MIILVLHWSCILFLSGWLQIEILHCFKWVVILLKLSPYMKKKLSVLTYDRWVFPRYFFPQWWIDVRITSSSLGFYNNVNIQGKFFQESFIGAIGYIEFKWIYFYLITTQKWIQIIMIIWRIFYSAFKTILNFQL